jgi:D-tyrosyl-tRNA(Tyr) deacylase
VTVNGNPVGEIGRGMVILLGARISDTEKDADFLADKILALRIFEDPAGKMNLSVRDVGGEILVVSQFTLYADTRKGRRPSFTEALEPQQAEQLYGHFVNRLKASGLVVATGSFGAKMEVELVNAGPVTLVLEKEEGKAEAEAERSA